MKIDMEKIQNEKYNNIVKMIKQSGAVLESVIYNKLFEENIYLIYSKNDLLYYLTFTLTDNSDLREGLDLVSDNFLFNIDKLDVVTNPRTHKIIYATKPIKKLIKERKEKIAYIIETIKEHSYRGLNKEELQKFKEVWYSLTNKDRLYIIASIDNHRLICFSNNRDLYFVGFPIIYKEKQHAIDYFVTTKYSARTSKVYEYPDLDILLRPMEENGLSTEVIEKEYLELSRKIIFDFQEVFFKLMKDNKISSHFMVQGYTKTDYRFPVKDNHLLIELDIKDKKYIKSIVKIIDNYCFAK